MEEFLLAFLATGLVLFAAVVAVVYVVVRAVFVRIAARQVRGLATGESKAAFLKRLDRVERVMDRAIPLPLVGGIGLDGLVGFIPYVGDATTAIVGGWLVYSSLQLGLPRNLVVRMLTNVFVDLLIGAVPVVGDLFDIAFKANTRNIALLRAHLADAQSKPGR